jgi:hypothetical protein
MLAQLAAEVEVEQFDDDEGSLTVSEDELITGQAKPAPKQPPPSYKEPVPSYDDDAAGVTLIAPPPIFADIEPPPFPEPSPPPPPRTSDPIYVGPPAPAPGIEATIDYPVPPPTPPSSAPERLRIVIANRLAHIKPFVRQYQRSIIVGAVTGLIVVLLSVIVLKACEHRSAAATFEPR